MTQDELYEFYHKRVFDLTGDAWCPYGSLGFMEAILLTDDDTAKQLIEQRRKYRFPTFLAGEPQAKSINEILNISKHRLQIEQ